MYITENQIDYIIKTLENYEYSSEKYGDILKNEDITRSIDILENILSSQDDKK